MDEVDKVVAAVEHIPKPWNKFPGGYPDQIEAALIDAVFSIRSKYGSETTGVRAVVRRYCDAIGDPKPDQLDRLASMDTGRLTRVLQNAQAVSGRSKAEAVQEAARNLVEAGVHRAADLDPARHRPAYTRVHGLGKVTWAYFCMLLGHQGVKADTWVMRWVAQALGEDSINSARANALVQGAAQKLKVDATQLDHAIWAHARAGGTA
ncbi:hypothetical protein [Ornithinimicrobium pratense]|uniref:HhH-GPD domain-containing protein n=1 Tax=Ornithinimicrobium pratense TaxID=2593973 RepID=A0A5J6V853_9MICO|nr:hypothetical protein [Ornithinimicrobium pratense]QFG69243.1 hypothetical protein FY030_11475 [Ornithinimicrobium pratense]